MAKKEAKKKKVIKEEKIESAHSKVWNSSTYKQGMMFFIVGAIIEMIGMIITNKLFLIAGLLGIFIGVLVMFNSLMKFRK